jgi:hypothetical protein
MPLKTLRNLGHHALDGGRPLLALALLGAGHWSASSEGIPHWLWGVPHVRGGPRRPCVNVVMTENSTAFLE